MENQIVLPLTQELIKRYEIRKKQCFISPNPYYKVGEKPSEYIDIKLKIEELKRLNSGVLKP